jgi:hypothetical protein
VVVDSEAVVDHISVVNSVDPVAGDVDSVVNSVDPVAGDVDSVVVVVVVVLLSPSHLRSPLRHPRQESSIESHC